MSSPRTAVLLSESSHRRQLLRIPGDQQRLLQRVDAWSTDRPNLPLGLVDDLKTFQLQKAVVPDRNFSAHQKSAVYLPQNATDGAVTPTVLAFSQCRDADLEKELTSSVTNYTADIPDASEDEEKSLCSWEASPDRQRRSGEAVSRSSTPPAAALSPIPGRKRPLARTLAHSASSRAALPASSAGDSTDLEFEVPGAITDIVGTVGKARLDPTPPSAQVIPCSYYNVNSSSAQPESEPKRRRRMKPLHLDKNPQQMGRLAHPAITRLPVMESTKPKLTTRSSQSSNIDEASCDMSGLVRTSTTQISGVGTSSSRPQKSQNEISTISTRQHDEAGSTEPEEAALQAPFNRFCQQYPGFSGNLTLFVRALFCVQTLELRKELPSFLYDDFIRVFSNDYLEYIRSQSDDSGEVLPAIRWYNKNVLQPHYTQSVINRNNLADALRVYSDEVNAAQTFLRTKPVAEEHNLATDRTFENGSTAASELGTYPKSPISKRIATSFQDLEGSGHSTLQVQESQPETIEMERCKKARSEVTSTSFGGPCQSVLQRRDIIPASTLKSKTSKRNSSPLANVPKLPRGSLAAGPAEETAEQRGGRFKKFMEMKRATNPPSPSSTPRS